jgi:hypothetical protein
LGHPTFQRGLHFVDPRDGYAKLTRRARANLLSRPTRAPILPSPRHDNNQGMVPLFSYLPMSCSTAYSDPPASGICLPQVLKYLGTLKLHLNSPKLCIICTICRYALHPDSVTRHVAKHKVPLRDRAALTSVVRSLHLPDPKSLSTRPDHSLAHPQLAVRHGYSCTLCPIMRQQACGLDVRRRNYTTPVSCEASCRHPKIPHASEKLSCVNASRFRSGPDCMCCLDERHFDATLAKCATKILSHVICEYRFWSLGL